MNWWSKQPKEISDEAFSDHNRTSLDEMIKTKGPVIADIRVEKEENCFPMIPSGAAHNEMILSSDDNHKDTSNEGLALV